MNGDRITRPQEPEKKTGSPDESGPNRPTIDRPSGDNELLKRLRKVDPNKAERYRQRSGQ